MVFRFKRIELRHWLPAAIFVVGLVVTLWASSVLDRREQAHLAELISVKLGDLSTHFSASFNELKREVVLLAEHGAHVADKPGLRWRKEASDYLTVFPSLQALAWLDTSARVVATVARDEQTRQILLDRVARQFANASPDRQAGDRGLPQINQLTFFQSGEYLLLGVPVRGEEDIRAGIVALYATDQLLDEIIGQFPHDNFTVTAFISSAAGQVAAADRSPETQWDQEEQLEFNGLALTLRISPTPQFLASLPASPATVAAISGLLISVLISLLVLRVRTRAVRFTILNGLFESEVLLRKNTEHRLENIVNNVPANIAYLDAAQRYVFANDGIQKLHGLAAEDVIGKRLSDVVTDNLYTKIRPHVESVLEGNREAFEGIWQSADGQEILFHTQLVPDFAENGLVLGFYSFTVDITHRKRIENELR